MDALKKAELAKRQGNGDAELELAQVDAPLSLAPVEPTNHLPQLPDHLEDLDEQFFTKSEKPAAKSTTGRPLLKPDQGPASPTAPAARPNVAPTQETTTRRPVPAANASQSQAEQKQAKNLFEAKAPTPPANNNRKIALALGISTLVATLAIGAYFWWQLQPKSSLTPLRTTSPPPPPASPPSSTLLALPNAAVPPAPTVTASPPPSPQDRRPANDADEEEETLRPTKPVSPRRSAETFSAPQAADSPVKISRAPLRVNPALARGYELFERGELNAARLEYERVLKSDPQSIDALHGMAAISLRENRPDAADHYFQRVLVADPQDAHAIAGLANLRGGNNPAAAESRLKGIVAAQPELAAPQFALGNLLAAQERWSEAQQAYFKAYSVEPGNPDILFNLAISLEHLRQAKLAAQYYALAIEAANRRPSAFDPAQAAARLRALQQP
jgi:Tfp pilus assembly protein PilF